MKNWGQLTLINLSSCNQDIQDRKKIQIFIKKLCESIGMKPFGKPLIKKFGKNNLRGYSLIQFIETSSITVHFDETGKRIFIDIFSCKKFNSRIAAKFSKDFFKARGSRYRCIYRS